MNRTTVADSVYKWIWDWSENVRVCILWICSISTIIVAVINGCRRPVATSCWTVDESRTEGSKVTQSTLSIIVPIPRRCSRPSMWLCIDGVRSRTHIETVLARHIWIATVATTRSHRTTFGRDRHRRIRRSTTVWLVEWRSMRLIAIVDVFPDGICPCAQLEYIVFAHRLLLAVIVDIRIVGCCDGAECRMRTCGTLGSSTMIAFDSINANTIGNIPFAYGRKRSFDGFRKSFFRIDGRILAWPSCKITTIVGAR